MMMLGFHARPTLAVLAALFALTFTTTHAAAAPPPETDYSVSGARVSKRTYPYLTLDSVVGKLRPPLAAQLPPPDARRLVILDVDFRANRGSDKLFKLEPGALQVQWNVDGTPGAAPVLGVHVSKDFMPMAPTGNFYTSMRPDTYELFAIVPNSARSIDLSHRQADGSFKLVKAKINIPPPRR
jgi:hypothetical protein